MIDSISLFTFINFSFFTGAGGSHSRLGKRSTEDYTNPVQKIPRSAQQGTLDKDGDDARRFGKARNY